MDYKIVNKTFYTKCRTIMRGTDLSAGVDLSACIENPIRLYPDCEAHLVPTGVAFDLMSCEKPLVGLLFIRSSVSLRGIGLANGVGLIDPDYQGEVKVPLINTCGELRVIEPGDRIAQLTFFSTDYHDMRLVNEFAQETARNAGGFGSTGN